MAVTEKKPEHPADDALPPRKPPSRRTQLESQCVVHFTTAADIAEGPFVNPGSNAEHPRRFFEAEPGAHFR